MADAKKGTAKEDAANKLNANTPTEIAVANMNIDGPKKEPIIQQTVATNSPDPKPAAAEPAAEAAPAKEGDAAKADAPKEGDAAKADAPKAEGADAAKADAPKADAAAAEEKK